MRRYLRWLNDYVRSFVTGDDSGDEYKDPRDHGQFVVFFWFALFAVAIAFLGLFFWAAGIGINLWGGYQFNAGVAILAALAAYTIASIRKVDPDKVGVIVVYGRPVATVPPGPAFVPFGITNLVLFPGVNIQVEMGTYDPPRDKDKNLIDVPKSEIEIKEESDLVIVRMYEPMRITFGDYKTGIRTLVETEICRIREQEGKPVNWRPDDGTVAAIEKQMTSRYPRGENPFNTVFTTDPQLFALFNISEAIQFLTRVGDIIAASRQIREVVMSSLQTMAARYTPAMAMEMKEEFDDRLRRSVEELILDPNSKRYAEAKRKMDAGDPAGEAEMKQRWGINLQRTLIKTFGHPYTVNKAAANNAAAGFRALETARLATGEAKATERKSIARKTELTNIGLGEAAGIRSTGEASVEVLGKRLQTVQAEGGMEVLRLETAREVANDANFIAVVPQGRSGDMLGQVIGGIEAYGHRNDPPRNPGQIGGRRPPQGPSGGSSPTGGRPSQDRSQGPDPAQAQREQPAQQPEPEPSDESRGARVPDPNDSEMEQEMTRATWTDTPEPNQVTIYERPDRSQGGKNKNRNRKRNQ